MTLPTSTLELHPISSHTCDQWNILSRFITRGASFPNPNCSFNRNNIGIPNLDKQEASNLSFHKLLAQSPSSLLSSIRFWELSFIRQKDFVKPSDDEETLTISRTISLLGKATNGSGVSSTLSAYNNAVRVGHDSIMSHNTQIASAALTQCSHPPRILPLNKWSSASVSFSNRTLKSCSSRARGLRTGHLLETDIDHEDEFCAGSDERAEDSGKSEPTAAEFDCPAMQDTAAAVGDQVTSTMNTRMGEFTGHEFSDRRSPQTQNQLTSLYCVPRQFHAELNR
ncbi:hypothetical protein BLNAU_8104 [Blattamonas nauphoetae]|uniref:Uncharacterized protein n=1 Tax=Blattamonas nauphoetae TaxID=2049346 RepID=A0ABQ9XZX6_9EUKA|nr:hypothetical protein BLNAU_8104 [Blattamonas nauphoetae]